MFIVTAASQELADMLARVLAFDGGIGSQISEVRDGVYTGTPGGLLRLPGGQGPGGAELAAREGIDLAASYAYSDSESDLPMLRRSDTRWRSIPTASSPRSPGTGAGRCCASTVSAAG